MKKINTIIETIEPIDIREIVGKKGENKNDQLKESHYLITVVDALKAAANKLGYDICTQNGFIYFFNGEYWQPVTVDELKTVLKEAAYKIGLDKYLAEHYRFIDSLSRQFFVSASILKKDNGDSIKINLQNGTYEFGEVCQLRQFNAEDFLTYQLPFNFNPEAKAPLFFAYLNKVLPDMECQNILAEFIGYVFTKGHKQQKCMLLYGSGSNGKSVFFEIVKAMLGNENITSYSLRNLGNENCRALINNKLLNYSSEIDANINKETFKQLCSGEPLQAKLLYRDSFTIENYAKLMFNCNELPKDVEFSNAYFRRFLIIPFTQTIPEAEQDKNLAGKIIATELSGIFNWVLSGLKRLTEQGSFTESKLVDDTLKEFKQDANSVYQYILAFGYIKGHGCLSRLMQLYKEYDQFCKDNGFKVLNISNFRKRLESDGVVIKRVANGNCVGLQKAPQNHEDLEEGSPFGDVDEDLPFPKVYVKPTRPTFSV